MPDSSPSLPPAAAPGRLDQVVVADAPHGIRLDTWLRGQFPAASRVALQRLIEQGHIRVDGRQVKPTHPPRTGEVVTVFWPAASPAEAQPEDIPLDVLYEDDDLIVINKPAGLVTHPGAGHEEGTLVNALLHHCAGRLSGVGGIARPGIVHRLDGDTSGCLVAAKNDAAHHGLSEQFASRTMRKIYRAIVCGEVLNGQGNLRGAIARHRTQRQRMAVVPEGGREAWTEYRVLDRYGRASFVEMRLHTGRTHQIRVHFQHFGYPLFGDDVYGRGPTARVAEWLAWRAPRQMLHAAELEFDHPRTGERFRVEAALPPDFMEALDRLRARRGGACPPGGPA